MYCREVIRLPAFALVATALLSQDAVAADKQNLTRAQELANK